MKKRLLTQMKWLMLFALLTSSLYAAADSMNSITGPTTITKGEDITLTVDFLASEERTVAVYFQSLNPKVMHFYKRYTVNADDTTLTVTFTVPSGIPAEGIFRYKAYIAPKGGKWSSNLGYASQERVTVKDDIVLDDTVKSLRGPATITKGEAVTLTADYVASEDRTLTAYLKATTGTKEIYFYKRITVHAGDELEQFTFTVPDNTPTDATYKYGTYIAPLGKYYKDNLGKTYQYGVKVQNADTQNPLTREELIQIIKDWANDPSQANADKIINADTSEITDMSGLFSPEYVPFMFSYEIRDIYSDLNETSIDRLRRFNLNISSWDVSNVTDMAEMFEETHTFNQPLNNWDVSNVTDMGKMFFGARTFNQPLNNWDVSNVTDMSQMFDARAYEGDRFDSVSFNQDISTWDVQNINYNPLGYFGVLNDRYNPFVRAEFKEPNVWHNKGIDEVQSNEDIRTLSLYIRPINYSSNAQMDTVIGFSDGEAQSYSDLGIIVRFSRDGTIDVRDGDIYRHTKEYRYVKNEIINIRIEINFDTHTYTVGRRVGLTVDVIAEDCKFRTEQSDLSKINNMAQFSNKEGTVEIHPVEIY